MKYKFKNVRDHYDILTGILKKRGEVTVKHDIDNTDRFLMQEHFIRVI